MTNLYVTSAETFSGKSSISIGLGMRFQADGLKVGYMKPVNVNSELREGLPFDPDVAFAKESFNMPEPLAQLGPVALTPAKLEQQLRGQAVDYEPVFMEAFKQVSADRDVIVLEGGRSWREGYIAGLPPKRVVEITDAQVILVLKYDDTLLVDRALAAQDYFGKSLIGVVINKIPAIFREHLNDTIVPYLEKHNLKVLGLVPQDVMLAAPSVAELAEGLHAEILGGAEYTGELVENMMVGAMTSEAALTHFRRKRNKAVITGGDRADIQMAALETSTRCLILTGNLYPSPAVLRRADELGVSVLLVNLDTLSTVEVVESFLGRSRVQLPQKIDRLVALLNEHFDFQTLYKSLGIDK